MRSIRAGLRVWGTACLMTASLGLWSAHAQLTTSPALQVPLTQGLMGNSPAEPNDTTAGAAADAPTTANPSSGPSADPVSDPAPDSIQDRSAPPTPSARKMPPDQPKAPKKDQPAAAPEQSAEDKMFNAAVEAVKDKRYSDAHDLFAPLAEQSVYDAQYNLALLFKRGLGRPQNYKTALIWSWRAQLGGIRRAKPLSEEVLGLLSEPVIEEVRGLVETELKDRIKNQDHSAIMQLAEFNRSYLAEPNIEEAYIWYSIAAAYRLPRGIHMREETGPEIDPERLIELQAEAQKRFDALQNAQRPKTSSDADGKTSPSSVTLSPKDQGV